MSEVFISYSRADREHALLIANALGELGVSTWMDTRIEGGEFDVVIQTQLIEARVVLVVWTPISVQSTWVRAEAKFGLDGGKYVGVLRRGPHERVQPYDKAKPADLRMWDGGHDYSEWRYVIDAIAARLNRCIGGRLARTPEEIERRRLASDPEGVIQRQIELSDIAQGKGTIVGAVSHLMQKLGTLLLGLLGIGLLLGLLFLLLVVVGWAGNGVVGWFG